MAIKPIIVLLLGLTLASVHLAGAQQPKKAYRVGFLSPLESPQYFEAFRRGMRELGYAEGQNLIIDYRSAKGMPERFPDLAAELDELLFSLICGS
jgi:putative tryptophan/tyrosine transport system substrate-binding protein